MFTYNKPSFYNTRSSTKHTTNPNGETNSTDEPHTTQNRRNHTHNEEEKAIFKINFNYGQPP
jgi:hypothetical protein